MPAVSQREYLRHSTGQDSADSHEQQLEQHAEPDTSPPPAPAAARPHGARRYGISRHTMAKFTPPERPDRSEEGHQARQPSAGHDQGVPVFPAALPGSHGYETPVPVDDPPVLDVGPAKPYYSAGMAHGVPTEPSHGGRPAPPPADQLVAQLREQTEEEIGKAPDPVPVFIVSRGAGGRPLKRAALRSVTVAAAGGDPQVIVPRNPHRESVRLLNESAVAARITFDLTLSGGALLPASMTSYLEIDTQDEICAYCPTGGPALISIIDQYDVPGA